MNIVVIHGSPRKGNTDAIIEMVTSQMLATASFHFHDVYLPRDVPVFCHGCFSCFERGEGTCPNAKYIQPIAKALEEADGLIIAAPIYVMQIPGALKSFFDHMAYRFVVHRPAYFGKKAFLISNTAGGGNRNALTYMKQMLSFWGIDDVTTLGITLQAGSIEEMNEKRQLKTTQAIALKSAAFLKQLGVGNRRKHPSFRSVVMFHIARALMLTLSESNADRHYWEQKGWLKTKNDFYLDNQTPFWYQTLSGKIAAYFAFK